MNRGSKILLIIMTIMFGLSVVHAGDIPEALMNGEQKALFIGELVDLNQETCTLQPITIMMGEITEEVLTIDPIEVYYGTSDVPTVGDHLVVVLLKDKEIDRNWLFKATSSDYQSLELISEKYDMVKRYEEYINDGEYFAAQARLDKNSNENMAMETPTEDVYQVTSNKVEQLDAVDVENAKMPRNKLILPLVLLIICLAIITKITVNKRK
ncbi:hypothetical protein [Vallitalea okinawensis]|uniref:hypothetical protein n=1 Tax=Vallitalea okinawensis TaxID=2078660 RepID=UPI000CFD2434|nr:hypothetical protein [Vallitalea okinawensis]